MGSFLIHHYPEKSQKQTITAKQFLPLF